MKRPTRYVATEKVLANLICVAVGTLSLHTWMQDLMSKEYAVGVVGVGNTGGAERIIVNFADLEDGQVRGGLHVSA